MTTPDYFSYLPNLEYVTNLDKAGNKTKIDIKDYFHLLKVREDIFKEDTLYDQYIIKNGERPEQVSYRLYGDERYYWTILQVNDITDVYNQWPLSSYELDEFIKTKYGFPNSEDIHHYETLEVKDQEGNVVLPAGLKVSEDFVFEYPSYPGSTTRLTARPVSVTYREYEYDLNMKKSQIYVIKKSMIIKVETEFKTYGFRVDREMNKSSQY